MNGTHHEVSPRPELPEPSPGDSEDRLSPIRLMLLALVVLGSLGLALELLLLEHFEDTPQLVPLILLGAAIVASVALYVRPSRLTVRAFQGVMVALIAGAAAGLYLHYRGNVEFEMEMDAALRGFTLVWAALRGATPTLAPGALAQIGIIGLILTYRHPRLPRGGSVRPPGA